MSNGLYFTFIQHQSSFYQCLAVTGGAGRYDVRICRKLFVNLFDSNNGSGQRASVVAAVEGVQQGTIFCNQSNFCCSGTCINSKIAVTTVCRNIAFFYTCAIVASSKFIVSGLICKQRIHTFYFEFHVDLTF